MKQELAQAKQQSQSLADQLAAAQTAADHWKRMAEANANRPMPEPPASVRPANPATVASLPTRTNPIGMEFIRIAAGKYERGARDNEFGSSDEKPRHRVELTKDFYVGKDEVTQDQYLQVMGTNPSYFCATGIYSERVQGMDTKNFPVENVSWYDAVEFCNKLSVLDNRRPYYEITGIQRTDGSISSATVKILGGDGYRLLTEAEWEYVARAGTDTIFPRGDSLSSTQANFDGNYPYGGAANGPHLQRTTVVGSYPANPWGLRDTAGNVYEWVEDWYGKDEYGQYAAKVAVDPTGPKSGLAPGSSVAAAGAATACSAGRRSASGARPGGGSTPWASVWPMVCRASRSVWYTVCQESARSVAGSAGRTVSQRSEAEPKQVEPERRAERRAMAVYGRSGNTEQKDITWR